jgi:cytochrome c-type biogenesis protein CcmF
VLIGLGGLLALIGRVAADVRRRVATRKIAARHAEVAR